MKQFIILSSLGLSIATAQAEVKPEGTILASLCGRLNRTQTFCVAQGGGATFIQEKRALRPESIYHSAIVQNMGTVGAQTTIYNWNEVAKMQMNGPRQYDIAIRNRLMISRPVVISGGAKTMGVVETFDYSTKKWVRKGPAFMFETVYHTESL